MIRGQLRFIGTNYSMGLQKGKIYKIVDIVHDKNKCILMYIINDNNMPIMIPYTNVFTIFNNWEAVKDMDLDFQEYIANREQSDTNGLIKKCNTKRGYAIFFGKDLDKIKNALILSENIDKQIDIMKKNVDIQVEPHYWQNEQYHLECLEKALSSDNTEEVNKIEKELSDEAKEHIQSKEEYHLEKLEKLKKGETPGL